MTFLALQSFDVKCTNSSVWAAQPEALHVDGSWQSDFQADPEEMGWTIAAFKNELCAI